MILALKVFVKCPPPPSQFHISQGSPEQTVRRITRRVRAHAAEMDVLWGVGGGEGDMNATADEFLFSQVCVQSPKRCFLP